ncbi:MAG: outer membrane protein assembly factor BamD [candidate division Zixibacteria bacterium]|nr:outer membrane protein assembly factor BamD [candidate division Zixibacteria bacterium]
MTWATIGMAVVTCGGTKPAPVAPPAGESLAKALSLYDKHKWDKAKPEFESVIFNHPGATIVDSAQFYLAMCNYRQRDYVVAADEFQRLRTRYPTSPLVELADLMRCRSLLRVAPGNTGLDQDQTETALAQLNIFRDNHPVSPLLPAVDSLSREAYRRLSQHDYRAALLYHRLGRYQAARIYFQEVIDKYTDSPLVPDALFFMGEGQRRSDSLDSAISYYEKLIYSFPDHPRTVQARKRVSELARLRDQTHASE